jgi:hypothetical protein
MRPISAALFALAALACAGERGPIVFNESNQPVTLEIVWKNGVANPPISLAPGNALRVQADDQPPRSLSIAYGAIESLRTETVELREWVQLDASARSARLYAAFVVTESKIEALSPDALSASPRARLAREAPAVDVDAVGLRRAFERDLDEALETLRARVAVGQSQREIEAFLNDLHLKFSVDRGRLVSSFYPTQRFPCLLSGVLDVTFDESGVARMVKVDYDAKCL